MPPGAPIRPSLPARARRDEVLRTEIRRVWEENFRVYGVRKVWRQLRREGIAVARCTVARLMRQMGLAGRRSRQGGEDNDQQSGRALPARQVNRQFQAPRPNALWVSDFTYVATWQGFVYVAFVIDVFARRIVGWRVSRTAMPASCWMRWSRRSTSAGPSAGGGLVHHSDRGVQGGIQMVVATPGRRGCDGHSEAALGSGRARCFAVAGSARGGAA